MRIVNCHVKFKNKQDISGKLLLRFRTKQKVLLYNIHSSTFLLFYVRTFFQGVIALSVGFLLADLRQGYKYPSCYFPSLFVFTLCLSPFPRNSYYIPLLFYDVGQHLKKQNLIFRTIYTFSHYLNVFNIFSVILRLVMKS